MYPGYALPPFFDPSFFDPNAFATGRADRPTGPYGATHDTKFADGSAQAAGPRGTMPGQVPYMMPYYYNPYFFPPQGYGYANPAAAAQQYKGYGGQPYAAGKQQGPQTTYSPAVPQAAYNPAPSTYGYQQQLPAVSQPQIQDQGKTQYDDRSSRFQKHGGYDSQFIGQSAAGQPSGSKISPTVNPGLAQTDLGFKKSYEPQDQSQYYGSNFYGAQFGQPQQQPGYFRQQNNSQAAWQQPHQ